MKCHIFALFCVLSGVQCSLVEINDTMYASLPPLYALDEWSHCQRPGDVYCMVDATLSAPAPSPLMDLLRDYSAQSLKHFDRTQLHRGVCVSRCAAAADLVSKEDGVWRPALEACLNETLWNDYSLQVTVNSVGWCSEPGPRPAATGARALGALVALLAALAALATSLHVLADRCVKNDGILGSNYLLAFSLRRNWQILTYDRTKPRQDDRMKDLAVLEGIRVLAIQCVIFSHVMFMYIYSYTDNPQYIEQMFDQFGWQIVFNSPLWLQSFFAISAFLTTYSLIVCSEKRPYSLQQCVLAVVTRWVRLTPAAVFALWFTISWFPLAGSGPQWGWLVGRESFDCSQRWWYHLLYTHNHLPLGQFCMGHTWYLAVDMQLHILGVVLLLLFLRNRRWVYPVLTSLVCCSMAAAGAVTWLKDLQPIVTAQAPENLRTLFRGATVMTALYLPSWMNVAGYAVGMAAAFLLHHCQTSGIKMNEKKWFVVLFHTSLTLGSACVMCGALFLQDDEAPRWARALYAAVDRTFVAVCFGVFMFGCVTRCKSALRSMFEWRGFHTLGRLSYCAFLIHFIVLRLTLAADTRLQHASLVSCISLFITASILTYLAAIPFCLLVELPFTQLWKTLVDGDKPTSPRPRPAHSLTPVEVKPFDLVANVDSSRRPVVRTD